MSTDDRLMTVIDLAYCGLADQEHGCCGSCGYGYRLDGPCWDCRGTGHAHPPADDEAFARAVLRAALGQPINDELPS